MTNESLPVLAILGGTGDLGTGLARRWAQAGYNVIIGSRTQEKAEAAVVDLQEVMSERGVAEVSVYVGKGERGKGLGLALLNALVRSSEENGIWTLQAGLFPENRASVRVHERMGFRLVGTRERLGRVAGIWRDVLLMERRSPVQGL